MHASELLDQPDREAVSVPIPDPLTTATPRRRRASLPVISVAISIVALLSGSALFLSGYSMGRQSAVEPGTPGDEGHGIPAVLGHLSHDRGSLRGRTGRS
jgi:hypothetical protein